jgi:S-adenosylmethionine-diacylglycerol 3-amino-3-carboxypropyl transferase
VRAVRALQFAVVREDPEIEASLVRAGGVARALVVASGGCTALALAAEHPDLDLTLLDVSPAQLGHVRRKVEALARFAPNTFNVNSDDPAGLNACGNFEWLFRGLRDFLRAFVAPDAELRERLATGSWDDLFSGKWWRAAFDVWFADPLLETMFGRDATQHAPPGSYPDHFRRVLEAGLHRPDARRNYFLHHILFGSYLPEESAWPRYLVQRPRAPRFTYLEQPIASLVDASAYDLVSLSNLFDWMAEAEAAAVAQRLARSLRPGARLVLRQLNHAKDFQRHFAPYVRFDDELGARLLAADRSLFYTRVSVGSRCND